MSSIHILRYLVPNHNSEFFQMLFVPLNVDNDFLWGLPLTLLSASALFIINEPKIKKVESSQTRRTTERAIMAA